MTDEQQTPTRVDHAAKAREDYDLAGTALVAQDYDGAMVIATMAQVQATLAAAEQQRIRNRLELAGIVAENERHFREHGIRAHLVGHEAAIYSNPGSLADARAELHDDIREGLGL